MSDDYEPISIRLAKAALECTKVIDNALGDPSGANDVTEFADQVVGMLAVNYGVAIPMETRIGMLGVKQEST